MPLVTPGRTAAAIISALGGTDAGGGLYSVGAAQAQIIDALGGHQDAGAASFILREDGSFLLREDGAKFVRE